MQMGTRAALAPNEWYHCYNRGVDKRRIFETTRDYERFLMLLYASNSKKTIHISDISQTSKQGPTLAEVFEEERGLNLVDIGAYCLMPNHFHILLRSKNEKGIALFMQKVSTGYTMYFNKRRERSGALLQGTYKARRIHLDQYFKRVLNYIHANPAELYEPGWRRGVIRNEKALIQALQNYRFSSLPEYLNRKRLESVLVNISAVMELLDKSPTLGTLLEEARIFGHEIGKV